jgi:hypothetical protein
MLHTRDVLINAIGVLVVDAMLLQTMLLGLLKHPHKNSTGMWQFLYRQVNDPFVLRHLARYANSLLS